VYKNLSIIIILVDCSPTLYKLKAGLEAHHVAIRILIIILIDTDDGVRRNIIDNSKLGNTWLHFTEKHNKYKLNIFRAVKSLSGEIQTSVSCNVSLIVQNILFYFCEA
jgi:hypothetical protein